MDNLLPELIQYIIYTFLDDKSMRMLRMVNRSWFDRVKYSHFTFHFPTTTIPTAVIDRLVTYKHPISMRIVNSIEFTNESLDQLARLTNLVSIDWPYYQTEQDVVVDWFRLSTLTNLVHWEYRIRDHNAAALLSVLSNLTRLQCDAFEYPEADAIKHATKLLDWEPRLLDPFSIDDTSHVTQLTRLRAWIYSGPYETIEDEDNEDDTTSEYDFEGEFIKHLESLVNLKYLELNLQEREGTPQIQFPPLSIGNFTALQSLAVNGIPIQDSRTDSEVDPDFNGALSKLTNLRSLERDITTVHDFNIIMPLTHLTQLRLQFKKDVKDLPLLTQLPHLETLHLRAQNNVSIDAAMVAQLTSVKALYLSSSTCRICLNSAVIGTLPNLEVLSIWCELDSTEFMSRLTKLKSANFLNVKFTTPHCLTDLTQLTELRISQGLDTVSWQCIGDLTSIERLYIRFEEGEVDLQCLTKFDRLKWMELQLSNVQVHNAEALFNMTALVGLELQDFGCIKDYSQISRLTQLTFLSVLGGDVTKQHVTNLTRLKHLEI